ISVCDLVIDLYEFLSKPNIPKARIFRIYGDVVQLSNTLEISPLNGSGAILIVARRIEIGPKCQIIINYKKFFRIIIYAAEITSGLEIIANNDSYKIEINDSKNVGKLLTIYDGKSPEYEDIHTFDNIILKNDSFFKILRYSLNIATALFYDDPRITRSILSWIVRITRESDLEETKDLYYHALTIFTKLNTIDEKKKNNIQFVPLLDMHIYKERIGEYMKFVKRYEEECRQILNDEQKIEMLFASLMDHSDSAKMHRDLNEGRKLRYESACELMNKIESELHEKRKYAESAFHGFKDGIKNWLDQQKYEAQKKLIIAIIELSLGIGKIVVQPGGVFSFGETIKKVADSFQEALDGVDLEKILEITADSDVKEKLAQVNDLNDHVDKIKQIKNELENDFNSVSNLNSNLKKEHGIIESLDIDALAKNLETIDQKGILLSTQWELTRRQMMKLLEFPVKQNIEGAETYLNTLENFFIFIDTYIKAKVQETESSEELLRTSLQAEMSKRKKERDHDEIKLQLIERLINIKFWMMLYLENYLCAFEYWSLSKSEIKLSVIKTFQELEDDIIKIRDELERAYKQFGCVPDLN
ncbi:7289_t:CDS:2, partial [Gigaspora rosea]